MTERISHKEALRAVNTDGAEDIVRRYITQQQASESASSDPVSRAELDRQVNNQIERAMRAEAQLTAQQAEHERVVGERDDAVHRFQHWLRQASDLKQRVEALEALLRWADGTERIVALSPEADEQEEPFLGLDGLRQVTARTAEELATKLGLIPASPSPAVGEESFCEGLYAGAMGLPSSSPQVAQAAETLEEAWDDAYKVGYCDGTCDARQLARRIGDKNPHRKPAQPAPGGMERCGVCGAAPSRGDTTCDCGNALDCASCGRLLQEPACLDPRHMELSDPTPSPALPGGLDKVDQLRADLAWLLRLKETHSAATWRWVADELERGGK